jgi:hypothetical protein
MFATVRKPLGARGADRLTDEARTLYCAGLLSMKYRAAEFGDRGRSVEAW